MISLKNVHENDENTNRPQIPLAINLESNSFSRRNRNMSINEYNQYSQLDNKFGYYRKQCEKFKN